MEPPLSRDLSGARDAFMAGDYEASRTAHDRLLGPLPRSRPSTSFRNKFFIEFNHQLMKCSFGNCLLDAECLYDVVALIWRPGQAPALVVLVQLLKILPKWPSWPHASNKAANWDTRHSPSGLFSFFLACCWISQFVLTFLSLVAHSPGFNIRISRIL